MLVDSCFAATEMDECGSCCSLLFVGGYVESLRPPPVQALWLRPTATPRLLVAHSCFAPAEAATGERERAWRDSGGPGFLSRGIPKKKVHLNI